MAIGKQPAEVVDKIIPNNGKRAYDPMDFGKLQSDLINHLELAIGKNPTELVGKFIPNTKDPRVYDPRGLGKMVESILIDIHSEKIWCLDGLHLLQEDGNKGEVNRHDNNHREELDGLNIPGDACKLTTHTDEDKENENSNKHEVILVEDEKTGSEHNAIDVIVAKLQDILTNGENTEVDMLIKRLTTTKEYTIKEVDDLIEKYEVRAPKTYNILSPAYRRNRLYKASKDPIKTSGDMHRDIIINLIDHCRSELNSGRAKLPYGVLKLYTETTPETALGEYPLKFDNPKVLEKCLFKFNDPKALQLVYCVNDSYKLHHLEVPNDPFLMVTTDKQNSKESLKQISLQKAVSQGIVSNIVEYFIATIYEFYKCTGMSKKKLRFKRQCDGECWVAEIKCSGGWIECNRISVENDAALEAKCDLSQTSLDSAEEKNFKKVTQAIEAMNDKEKKKMMDDLNSKGEHELWVGTLQRNVTIKPDMLKEKNTVYVVVVSSWIGRIVSCLYAHAYTTKQGKKDTRNVFSSPSLVAPYKCFVSVNNKNKQDTELTKKSLEKAGIQYIAQTQGKRDWNTLIIPNECGCQFVVRVSSVRVSSGNLVTIRNRESERTVGVESDRVGQVIEDVLSRVCTWKDTCEKYPCGRCFLTLSICNCKVL